MKKIKQYYWRQEKENVKQKTMGRLQGTTMEGRN